MLIGNKVEGDGNGNTETGQLNKQNKSYMSFFSEFGRKPSTSTNPTTVILTKFLGPDYYFERRDHAPNFRFAEKRYATEEAALVSIGNNILNGDAVEFIDSKERCIKRYVKGSGKVTILKNGETVYISTNF